MTVVLSMGKQQRSYHSRSARSVPGRGGWLLTPRPRQAVILLSVLGQVGYATSIFARHGGHSGFFWDGIVGSGSPLLGLLAVVRRRGSTAFGIAVAATVFIFLNVAVGIPATDFGGHGPLTAPLPVQLLWLSPYVAFLAHLVLLARSRLIHTPRSVWLDAVIVGLAATALVGATWLAPLLDEWSRYWFGGLVYAVDLLLLGVVLGVLAATGWKRDRQVLLVLIGGAAFATSDMWAIRLGVQNRWHLSSYSVAVLVIASLAVQASCWSEPHSGRSSAATTSRVLFLPIGGALLATTMLGIAALATQPPAPAVVLALVALGLSLLRWGIDAYAARNSHLHRRLSQIDELTGIANRRGFYQRIDSWCAPGSPGGLTALIVDLDGFKSVNDSHGHHVGDAVLIATAERLTSLAPPDAAVARLGGDEFAVCAPLPDERSAEALARTFAEALCTPVSVPGREEVRVGASVGGVWSAEPVEREVLLRAADRIMYRVKSGGLGGGVTALHGASTT